MEFYLNPQYLAFSAGFTCQLVESSAQSAPCQTQLLPQGPRSQHAPSPVQLGKDTLCRGGYGSRGPLAKKTELKYNNLNFVFLPKFV